MKKIIINADDFGYSKSNNLAIQKGAQTGVITSTSLMANMDGFEHAVNDVLPSLPADVGVHLNIIEGKSLTNQSMLCDKNGNFNNSYGALILKSLDNEFLKQVETEFRAQIEKILQYTKVSHIDSHVHTHAIPAIFNKTTELAKEYDIPFVRTQSEKPYKVKEKPADKRFFVNTIKNALLNTFSFINKRKDINTNDNFIGVLYTGNMDENSIIEGLKKIQDDSITEVIFHPNLDEEKKDNYREFLITQNESLKQEIKDLGFELTNFSICTETLSECDDIADTAIVVQ